ncbi:hypothetical protein HWV62_21372 [Athelia sp. TMB]|nr:hypothetical protein HWV62_26036 [Athelia sp. TMB]KAF7971351.1 hypothetical protein HWV62_21372 [Athelia sp. TMB]
MLPDKYIGLLLALSSSLAIGTSFIITKKGLNDANRRNAGFEGNASDNLTYLKNPIWWAALTSLPVANFAAYTFAPPILVTPLGALSVLIGAVLASFLLNEELGHLGRVGCALCLIGSLIIVLHAPEDKDVQTVDEIMEYATHPGFMLYCLTVAVVSLAMIYGFAPKYGRKNPLVYITVCSLVGSVSVMAVKGFGVAVKLTFGGNNQFTHFSAWFFMFAVAGCAVTQMNYLNKALETFSTNVVNPMYYVGFSSCTILASLILFQGFNTTDGTNTVTLLAGFVVTFLGVHLLNLSRKPEAPLGGENGEHGLMNPRRSLQRMSMDGWSGGPLETGLPTHGRQSSLYRAQTTTLFNAFEEHDPNALPLGELPEEDDDDDDDDDEADEHTLLNTHARPHGVRSNSGSLQGSARSSPRPL